jgi:hypothetical protein
MFETEYEYYTQNVSTTGAAVSFETTQLIVEILTELLKNKKEQIWVDTGSGFSSFVLRKLAQSHENIKVYSFDDNAGWLNKTISFCDQKQVSSKNILEWKDAPDLSNKCSFVFHDLGTRDVRHTTADAVLNMLELNGIIIFDDMHKENMREKIIQSIEKSNTKLVEQEETKTRTLDNFGRWVIKAIKTSSINK